MTESERPANPYRRYDRARVESAITGGIGQRCPLCPVQVQRTPQGTLADGMAAHRLAVHKGEEAAR